MVREGKIKAKRISFIGKKKIFNVISSKKRRLTCKPERFKKERPLKERLYKEFKKEILTK